MMGRTHALTGWCGGLVAAPLVGATNTASVLVFAVATTGAALLPDFDHPNAKTTRLLGPATRLVGWALRRLSRLVYMATAAPSETGRKDPHRTLTHTLVFAVTLGVLVVSVTAATGVTGALVVAGLMLLLAVDALGGWMIFAAAPGMVAAAVDPGALEQLPVALGVAVGLGCVIHVLGDWASEAPVPMLWPIPIGGKRWWPCNAPKLFRFRVGGKAETHLLVPLFAALGVLLIPGVGEAVGRMVDVMAAV